MTYNCTIYIGKSHSVLAMTVLRSAFPGEVEEYDPLDGYEFLTVNDVKYPAKIADLLEKHTIPYVLQIENGEEEFPACSEITAWHPDVNNDERFECIADCDVPPTPYMRLRPRTGVDLDDRANAWSLTDTLSLLKVS